MNWLAGDAAQQLVMDSIAPSVSKNITESTDLIRTQTAVAIQGGDVPVWYAVPELIGSGYGDAGQSRRSSDRPHLGAGVLRSAAGAAVKPSGAA
ncbi:MAG: hypothetical protein R2848_00060 [Thermomicrobiales bacterium]